MYILPAMEDLLLKHGYILIFIGVLLEGETPVVLGGMLARTGRLSITGVFLSAFLATFLGDQLYFHLARWKGRVWLEKFPAFGARVHRVQPILRKGESAVIFLMRFMYGFRVVIPALLGLSAVSRKKYLFWNALGAVVWTVLYGSIGHLLGQWALLLVADIQLLEKWIVRFLLVSMGAIAFLQLIRFLRGRTQNRSRD